MILARQITCVPTRLPQTDVPTFSLSSFGKIGKHLNKTCMCKMLNCILKRRRVGSVKGKERMQIMSASPMKERLNQLAKMRLVSDGWFLETVMRKSIL